MAKIYANLIIAGRITFERVPETLKAKVKEILIACEMEELIK